MGVREGNSTWAFLSANPKKFVGYDIVRCPQISDDLESCYPQAQANIKFEYQERQSVLETEIEPTDLALH
jgi:hypothetical protein